ncbi:MAG: stage III sporulation AC/AD family protein [Clostridia bacterium]|nr:stage III sporulation AC/AD family protein [Clostridia bacterium]
MGILQLSGIALLAAVLILFLRELRPAFVAPLRLGASVILVGAALLLYAPVLARVQTLFGETGAGEYMDVVLRALGIALICELTALFCRDLGENTLAQGVQLFGKLEILVLSLPLVDKVLEMAKELLQY